MSANPLDTIKSMIGKLTIPSCAAESDKATLCLSTLHRVHEHPHRERLINELGYIGWREDGVLKTLTFELADERAVMCSWEERRDAGGIHVRGYDEYYVPRDLAVGAFLARFADTNGQAPMKQFIVSEDYAEWCEQMKATEPKRFNKLRTRHAH